MRPTLGVGGPGGAGVGLSGGGLEEEWTGAVAAVESASNAAIPRGGAVLDTILGNFQLDATDGFYDLDLGYTLGAIAFDDDSTWHFDYATLLGAGENDFYSVALHEILHSLGFGSGNPYIDGVFDTNIGQEAAMDPNLTVGTRKYITTLDLAFLEDMGYERTCKYFELLALF